MKMKKTLLTSTLLLCATMPAGITNAQDNSEYERWRAATQQSFQTYLDDNDKAFIGFLKQRWEEVETETGKNEDTAPKPLDIPVAPPVIAPVIISTPTTQPKPLPDKPDPSSSPVISVITPNPQPIVIPAAPPNIPPV
jgi:hypothetical protein